MSDGVQPTFCAIVSDGAGSAEFGGEGASLVCRLLSQALRSYCKGSAALPPDETLWSWIDLTRDRLALAAERRGAHRRSFASTLVMMAATDTELLTLHVGDGAIAGRERTGAWRLISEPENGEYASTTYFVTDDPAPRVRIRRLPMEHDACALFSDGLESIALDLQAMAPHEPFFRTMLNPLDQVSAPGKSAHLSAALAGFLDSPRVCERTDDDKTLILASSR